MKHTLIPNFTHIFHYWTKLSLKFEVNEVPMYIVHTYYSLLSSKPRNIERARARETPCITSLWKNASCCQSWTANERWTEIMHPGAFTPSSSSCHYVAKLILGYYRLFLTRIMQSFIKKIKEFQQIVHLILHVSHSFEWPLRQTKIAHPNNLPSLFGLLDKNRNQSDVITCNLNNVS
jgi:hypothetical protein